MTAQLGLGGCRCNGDLRPSEGSSTGGSGGLGSAGTTGGSGGQLPDGGSAGGTENCACVGTDSVQVATLTGSGAQGYVDGPPATSEFSTPWGLAVGADGDVYVVDTYNYRIRRVDLQGNVSTFAGSDAGGTFTNGPALHAGFFSPYAIATATTGAFYVSDACEVRELDAEGNVSTLAGNGSLGHVDGPATEAEFCSTTGIAVDAAGNVYVGDLGGCAAGEGGSIRIIDPSGNVTTLAGNGGYAVVDGTGGPQGTAEFRAPDGLAVDGAGNVYVVDTPLEGTNATQGAVIRRIDAAGNVTTIAGDGVPACVDGSSAATAFFGTAGLAIDATGTLYVAEFYSDVIRRIDPSGAVTTLAGCGDAQAASGAIVNPGGGRTNGPGPVARFYGPWGIAVAADGTLYVTDSGNNLLRSVTGS